MSRFAVLLALCAALIAAPALIAVKRAAERSPLLPRAPPLA